MPRVAEPLTLTENSVRIVKQGCNSHHEAVTVFLCESERQERVIFVVVFAIGRDYEPDHYGVLRTQRG
jgi:hypothetical protein